MNSCWLMHTIIYIISLSPAYQVDNVWIYVRMHCMCWLSSSPNQLTWIIYLSSSCFDPGNCVYGNVEIVWMHMHARMSVHKSVPFSLSLSLRDNWVSGGSIWSAEEWFSFIICHHFQQRLSREAVSVARHTFQSDRWCWIVNTHQSLSVVYRTYRETFFFFFKQVHWKFVFTAVAEAKLKHNLNVQ